MKIMTMLTGTSAILLLAASSFAVAGETDKEKALSNGARQLTADELAQRFAGETVTFESASGDKRFLIYYGEGNDLAGKMVGGDWSDTGFYGVANDDSICLSWEHSDKPRLRCMDVLIVDGVAKKFKADGSLSGSVVKFEEGKKL